MNLKRRKNGFAIGFLFALGVMMSTSANAQMAKFEALYLYNISRYVEWPASFNAGNFVIGVVGNNPELIENLKAISGSKTIQGKKVIIKPVSSSSQGSNCHILFFSKGTESKLASYKSVAKNSLLISESNGGLKKGADLNFFIANEKLKFELSKGNIDAKQLNVSTSLVQLAAKVI